MKMALQKIKTISMQNLIYTTVKKNTRDPVGEVKGCHAPVLKKQ